LEVGNTSVAIADALHHKSRTPAITRVKQRGAGPLKFAFGGRNTHNDFTEAPSCLEARRNRARWGFGDMGKRGTRALKSIHPVRCSGTSLENVTHTSALAIRHSRGVGRAATPEISPPSTYS
jgi:hypothetical protein